MGNILETDSFYMSIVNVVSQRSHATRKKVGAIIVKDKNIISFGWNGTPTGYPNQCEDSSGKTLSIVIHAEANAICKAAKGGGNLEGATLYVTLSPCIECSKLIIQSGIKRVIFSEIYRDIAPLKLLKKSGIKVNKLIYKE
jgi:dCMP deaminase